MVGAIIKKVRNSASDTITVLGGVCCMPMAVRKNDRTTTIRVNDVIIINIDGANDKTVISATICTTRPVTVPSLPAPRSMDIFCANAGCENRVTIKTATKLKVNLLNILSRMFSS